MSFIPKKKTPCKSKAAKSGIRKGISSEKKKPRKSETKTVGKAKDRKREVYRGVTKYIDPETKRTRRYVILKDNQRGVTVAKLKSIKSFDSKGKNTDPDLLQINHKKYNLEKETGVYYFRFSENRLKKKPLRLSDKDVFPSG